MHALALSLILLNPEPALPADRNTLPSPMERARDLVKENKPDQALAVLSSYLPDPGERSLYHALYARTLVQAERAYESIEHYRMAYIYSTSQADKEQLLLERAETYSRLGYDTEAAVCLDVLLKTFPKSSLTEQAELGIAEARYRLGEYRESLAHFEKSGTSLRASYGKAGALQRLGRSAEAHEIYQRLLKEDPNILNSPGETLYNMAESFRQSGNLNDSRIYFNAVKDDAFKYKASLGLGMIAMDERSYDRAAEQFRAASASPERAIRREAILLQAEAFTKLGSYNEAEAALQGIRKNYPYGSAYDRAALLLARLYRERGRYEDSLRLLKELIYRRTPSGAALDELETILLEAAGRKSADMVKLWSIGGRWLLEPTRSPTLVRIARGLRHTGKPFIDVCTWLIRYGPGDAKTQARLLLADFYAGLGDTATASSYLARARVKGHSDEAVRVRARIDLANRKPVPAAEGLMTLREAGQDDLLLLLDAVRSADPKRVRSAVDYCDRQFKKSPGTLPVYIRLADLLVETGQRTEALRYYKEALDQKSVPGDGLHRDREWAHYRIAELSGGAERAESLKSLRTSTGAVGRFAEAELRSAALRRKVE